MQYKKNPEIEIRVDKIAQDLANGLKRREIARKYASEWGISERTIDRYVTDATPLAQKYINLSISQSTQAFAQAGGQSAAIGIKTKQDRIDCLQRQVEAMELELLTNKTYFPVFKKPSPTEPAKWIEVSRQLSMTEKTALRRTIATITSLISDLQGDFPLPTKMGIPLRGTTSTKKSTVLILPSNGR